MRMPRYEIRNDGVGPYATFYCDKCYREFRSQPEVGNTIAGEVGRSALGGLLRNVPLVGNAVANNMESQQYTTHLNPQQLEGAWRQVQEHFHECPTCHQIVCPSDWDAQANTCTEDSPRRGEIAQAQAEQAAGVLKGVASVFGLGGALSNAGAAMREAATKAAASAPRCSQCGTPAAPGTKFCARCGGAMVQPTLVTCPTCQAPLPPGTAFCTSCGAKVAAPAAAAPPATCPTCGTPAAPGVKFCGTCGTKLG